MSITYLEAIREAQAKALADDPRVFIYGQDVGNFGGAFKATKNLAKEFPGRVIDAPISEDAIVGSAIGAAIEGMRPIIEMQFADFSTGALTRSSITRPHFFGERRFPVQSRFVCRAAVLRAAAPSIARPWRPST